MVDSKINTLTAFLLIVIVLGVGLYVGNASLTSDRQEIYYDWDSNIDLSLEDGVVIETLDDNSYKTITFNNEFNFSEDKEFRLTFEDGLDLSNVTEFYIEYGFSQVVEDNLTNFNFVLLDGGVIDFDANGTILDYDRMVDGSIAESYFGQEWTLGEMTNDYFNYFTGNGYGVERFDGGLNSTTIKYKINTDDGFITLYKYVDGVNVDISVESLEETNLDLENFDFSELIFGLYNENTYGFENNIVGNDTISIDYLKLTYNTPLEE
jgi:hypothetical protein